MTLIKKIKLHGFKSFAKSTELIFGNSFNVVLGPNGSGKSNIMDALCFVLGKSSAKGMRADKSANLIYNGGKTGKPLKEALVSIFFDNSKKEFPISDQVVKISRIVRNSGQSIYKINDKVRTRQQVLDLLSTAKIDPNGHNITLQGDIAYFIEMPSKERREIIEEIAGISVYEDKKQKALNELEKVDTKLSEAQIILTERSTYLKEIQKERDQALKYKDAERKIKENKATLLNTQLKEREEKKNNFETTIDRNQKDLETIENNLNEYKRIINSKKESIKNTNKEIEQKGGQEQLNLSKEITNTKTSIIKNTTRTETLTSEIEKIKTRKKQLNNSLIDIEKEVSSLGKKKSRLQSKKKELLNNENKIKEEINSFKEKHGIQDFSELNEKIDNIEKNIETLQASISELQENKQLLIRDKDKLEIQNNILKERLNSIEGSKGDNKLRALRQEFKKTTLGLTKILNEESIASAQLQKARSSLVKNNEELARLKARNISIKEYSATNFAVKKILSLKNSGIYGTVAQLGKVNSKYALALEVAAGSRIKSIVVDSDITAAKCIKLLKENKLGVVTFLPLNKIRPISTQRNKQLIEKTHGFAVDLIKYDQKFRNVFSYVFGSTLVVDDIETARRIGIGHTRMVTLTGDLIEPSGAMIGGFRRKTSYGFKEEEIDNQIQHIIKEVSRLRNISSVLENRKLDFEKNIIDLKQKKADLEINITKLEKTTLGEDVSKLKKENQDLDKRLPTLNKRLKDIEKDLLLKNKEILNLKSKKQALKEKSFATKSSKVSSNLNDLEGNYQELKDLIAKTDSEIKNMVLQIDKIHLPEKDRIKQIVNQHEKENSEFLTELNSLKEELKKQEENLKNKESKEKQFYNNFKNLSIKRNKLTEEIQKVETSIIKEQEKAKIIGQRINSVSLGRAKITAEIEGLKKEFEEFRDAKIRRNINMDELKYEIRQYEKILNEMGNVNLKALEIYDQLEKEHQKLIEKADKLKLEKEDVIKMMQEIEARKKGSFMETFNAIASKFTSTFSELSTKGQAYLDLENKEEPLSEGLNIRVRIAGDKFLDIRSLSGGEKTLAALALIFAIQEYSPASFYFLDEVDAALDKKNSEMLSKLVKKYSSKAQYILISHNDSVITEANQIYGVSMQKDGISKIISLKL